ncbi:multi antimicrobial extrusion protein MatE [Cohnella rhizosphaerae]|uniref:Multi antimicrobial extrusion protein MatE n=1 Tax=Cohnella rhizosphaerae TaxID=1457232 RepID=A0A9X4QWF8_9BACL|nr:multi antimicrobial extrusion protein MatE [Cohnella rhizosphaerae]MDG0813644.1 multi antimicrobial extrusion protein MatE [Cohnella rhizosphaerae]
MTALPEHPDRVSLRTLFLFFIPLGVSAVLINLSHVIINGTLARADDPELVIAGYATAMSLLTVSERPAILFRETCSALVRDRVSYQAILKVAFIVFGASLAFGATIGYTPVGTLVFAGAYGAERDVADAAVGVYHVLMFLSIFSGIRCLYQGIIIYKMKTRWLTIGMVFRLGGMFLMAQYIQHIGVTSSMQGAVIFVFGMMIEAFVSWLEGRNLARKLPSRSPDCEVQSPRQILRFYNPLLFSSFIVVWVPPILNALLGNTDRGTLSISSFAVAGSLTNLCLGFFTYFHQIALQFYRTDPGQVRRFVLLIGFIPAMLLSAFAFTPAGDWMLAHLLGVEGRLLDESMIALRGFIPFVLIFPWLDTLNGIILSKGQTKLMFGSQTGNAVVTTALIVALTITLPGRTGILGALAQSGGMIAELGLLYWLFKRATRTENLDTLAAMPGEDTAR